MKESFEKKYHEIETRHFWFKARRQYILQYLKDFPRNSRILDIGSSSGILLNELAEMGFDRNNLYGVDISANAIRNCKENGIENAFVMDAQNITLEQKFDVVIASDCLEHLKDDEKALKNWNSLLQADGTLLVFVPALMALWSEHDVENMHFRRYTKTELETKLKQNGFSISKASYWNFFLFLPIYAVRLLSRLMPAKKSGKAGDLEDEMKFNTLFYNLINSENKLLKYINLPIGVSTYCIAKKQA